MSNITEYEYKPQTVEEGLDLIDRKYDGFGASNVERRVFDPTNDGDPWAIIQQFVVADQPAQVVVATETVGQMIADYITEHNRQAGETGERLAEVYDIRQAGEASLRDAVYRPSKRNPNATGIGSIVLSYGLSQRGQFGWSGDSQDPTFHPVLAWSEVASGGVIETAQPGVVGYVQLYQATSLAVRGGVPKINMKAFPASYWDDGSVREWHTPATMHGIVKLYWEESDMTQDMERVRRAVQALSATPKSADDADKVPEVGAPRRATLAL